MIDLGLSGKRAVVSGAGFIGSHAGHGRSSALTLARAGATVVCIDIDERRALSIVAEIAAAGGQAHPVVADMTEQDQVERAVGAAVETMGGVDVCVDVIGKATFEPVEHISDEAWQWTMKNNLTHVLYLFQAAARQMVRQGTGGALVAIASVDGIGASGFHAAYGAAKAGVISLTRTFADELGRYGIRANAVAPGNVGGGNWDEPDAEFGSDPVNPLAPPRGRDIGNAVLFLSSALASRITGQTLIVDGGVTIRSPWGFTAENIQQIRAKSWSDRGTDS
jgi:NAD(P)-dependent dehydrogenase (short-subunit alcohol dehydrogenase family)